MAVAKKKAEVTESRLDVACKRTDLVRAVATLRQISGARTYPITSHLLLRSSDGGLTVEASNLEIFGTVSIFGQVGVEGGVTVDAKRLGEFVRELPDDSVHIVGQPNDSVEIRSGRSRAKLTGMSAGDFPVSLPPDGSECRCTLDGDSLGDMIDRTIFAAATDDVRPMLAGVLLEMHRDRLGMAATDGHRLSHEEAWVECSAERKAVVPATALRVVRRALGSENVTVAVSGSVVWFSCADWMIGSRLIEGDYPDYAQVIPKDGDATVVEVARDELLSCVRRVSVVASDRSRGMRFRVADGAVELEAQSADYGEATEYVACEVVSGSQAEAGFNAAYLAQALEAVAGAERVRIRLGSDQSPAVISVPDLDGWLHVVMPMRI